MKSSIYLSICLLILICVGGCKADQESKKNKEATSTNSDMVHPDSAAIKEIVGIGKVSPAEDIISLSATAGGIVQFIDKQEGDSVHKGEAILHLNDAAEQLQLQQIRAQLNTQQSQIDFEKLALKEKDVDINNKLKNLSIAKNLFNKGAETKQVVDDLEKELALLQVSKSKSELTIHQAIDKANELTALIKLRQLDIDQKVLYAPFDGLLLQIEAKVGTALTLYQTYATIAPAGNKIVKAEVDELYSAKLKEGQRVDIQYVGTNQPIATGRLIFLSPYLQKKSLFSEKTDDQEDRRVRQISISLNGNPAIILNAKVECVIHL
jgi:multidrug efflux pump subunit AcrA (membrane-fusion protein)